MADKKAPEISEDEEIVALQKKLLVTQLRTAEMQLAQAAHTVDKFDADTRTKEQKAKAAQESLREGENLKRNLKTLCRHKQGGIGNDGTFKGKGEPSLLMMDLPIAGHEYIQCYRCGSEWKTPPPDLEKTEPKQYKHLQAEFTKMKELYLDSSSTKMGVPQFMASKNGVPVIPALV